MFSSAVGACQRYFVIPSMYFFRVLGKVCSAMRGIEMYLLDERNLTILVLSRYDSLLLTKPKNI